MSECSKAAMIYRCPVCFARENDVVLHGDGSGGFYCIKCSFTGTEQDIQSAYGNLKIKYRNLTRRLSLEEIRGL